MPYESRVLLKLCWTPQATLIWTGLEVLEDVQTHDHQEGRP